MTSKEKYTIKNGMGFSFGNSLSSRDPRFYFLLSVALYKALKKNKLFTC